MFKPDELSKLIKIIYAMPINGTVENILPALETLKLLKLKIETYLSEPQLTQIFSAEERKILISMIENIPITGTMNALITELRVITNICQKLKGE